MLPTLHVRSIFIALQRFFHFVSELRTCCFSLALALTQSFVHSILQPMRRNWLQYANMLLYSRRSCFPYVHLGCCRCCVHICFYRLNHSQNENIKSAEPYNCVFIMFVAAWVMSNYIYIPTHRLSWRARVVQPHSSSFVLDMVNFLIMHLKYIFLDTWNGHANHLMTIGNFNKLLKL